MSDRPEARVSIAAGVTMGVITLAAACGLYLTAIAGVGFPDGHRTDYERWSLPLATATVVALGLLGLGFPGLAAVRSPRAPRLFKAAIVALVLLVVTGFVLIPRIGQDILRLEHGQGG